jgi:archaellum component FlaG (FlaF/FlaG flagellin family)
MKTVMQELIDEMDIIKGQLWQEGLKDKSAMISDMIKKAVNKLEKEKEQITKAWDDGDYAYFYNKETGRDFENGEQYFNQTYNN